MAEVTRVIKLVHVTTIPTTQLMFFRGQVQFMKSHGFEVYAVSSPGKELEEVAVRDGIAVHPIPISRKISPFRDLLSVWRLLRLFRKIKPDIVHLSTPKAALLGAIASAMARVPIRIFYIRGSITENARGLRKVLYRACERLISKRCHLAIAVSPSLLDYVRSEGIVKEGRGRVMHHGMSNGVDGSRFDPEREGLREEARGIREGLGIPDGKIGGRVITFIGRLACDKGIEDLWSAWSVLREEHKDLHLLVIGRREENTPVVNRIMNELHRDPSAHYIGFVGDTVPYYAASDLVVFPSHGTEGFPNVPMEAAAMRLPVIATRVVGCVDAVIDGVTGILVPPRDPKSLVGAVNKLLHDQQLRDRMGKAGRKRVLRDFRSEDIWEALYREYTRLLRAAGC